MESTLCYLRRHYLPHNNTTRRWLFVYQSLSAHPDLVFKYHHKKKGGQRSQGVSHLSTSTITSRTINNNISRKNSNSTDEQFITTDEGVIVYKGDPSSGKGNNGLGLVWGSVLWPAGICLSKYFTSTHGLNFLREKQRVLELGCGTGVVGLTLAKHCDKNHIKHVTLSDFESSLWPLIRKSIHANNIPEHQISIQTIDWKDPDTFLMGPTGQHNYDLIVAADVLYSGMDKLFTRALASHIPSIGDETSNKVEAIVACPYRTDSPLLGFFDACQRLGLSLERLENTKGEAVGTYTNANTSNNDSAFDGCKFVPIKGNENEIATKPTFSYQNVKQIQIFKVCRISGYASDAASIRRLARI